MNKAMLTMVIGVLAVPAAAQIAVVRPGAVQAIGPKQDDPRTACGTGTEEGRGGTRPTPGGKLAIGPKQDDPRTPGVVARPGDDEDPHASGGGAVLAIGPKQDDPRSPGVLAIGPKQDDPRSPGVVARPGDDEDPHAIGRVGALAIADDCGSTGPTPAPTPGR